ncbi:MAG: methyltransferase domain-containing protein [Saprospiraceae bacterium]|nr:methyltransferase domain-containing protein [Candidatus Opimibacter skivensis]
MEIKRRPFQGVLNILSFNRHFYFFGIGVLAILIASRWYVQWNDTLFWLVIAAFMYGLLMPLLVSAYVYDFSGFYKFDWLKKVIGDDETVDSIVNINAGFDETSFILESKFPKAVLRVFDFYNQKRHTEPAIIRARKVTLFYPNTQSMESDAIPLENASIDIVFLLSAVHEIRLHDEKVRFLKECHRVIKPDGKVIMVEHLRDLPNFVAFTIGFTHFFSRATWKKAFAQAGFTTFEEKKFTPFMSIFKSTF